MKANGEVKEIPLWRQRHLLGPLSLTTFLFFLSAALSTFPNHEFYKRQRLISDFTEAQCGNTAAEQIWTFATSTEGTYRSLSFPKMISLCETPDHTKLMTTQLTLSHKYIHLAILFFYMLCVVSVIRFFKTCFLRCC